MNTRWLVGVAFFLVVSGPGRAQLPGQTPSPAPPGQGSVAPSIYPAEMTIVIPEVEVRSGPTTKYYPTSKLRMGERVQVLRESKDQAGWLAIKPPPGSFSWIQAKFVKQVNVQTGYIPENTPPVAVMPGSSLTNQAPNVEAVKIGAGTQVVILDRPFQVEGETWLPIQPPPTEVRFIPADAVRLPTASPPVAVTPPGFPTAIGGAQNLFAQGNEAVKAGKVDQAKDLFRRAAEAATDPYQKTQALNAYESIRVPGWQPNTGRVDGTFVSRQPPQWGPWGYLRQTSMNKDGQAVFVLENRQGQPLLYAVPQNGTSLKDYVGRMVCLYGPLTYRSEDWPRVQYIVASHVALP